MIKKLLKFNSATSMEALKEKKKFSRISGTTSITISCVMLPKAQFDGTSMSLLK